MYVLEKPCCPPHPQSDADSHQACRRVALQQHPDQHLVIYSLGATETIRSNRRSSVSRADQSRRSALPSLQTPPIHRLEGRHKPGHEKRDGKAIPASHQRPDTSIPAPQRFTPHLQGDPGGRATGKDARSFSRRDSPHRRRGHHSPNHPHL